MNICKNPECKKEIADNLGYCNEDCLRKHQEIKKRIKVKGEEPETIFEIKEIMDCLGKGHSEGYIKGTHTTTILSYLRQRQQEPYRVTKAKLAFMCGIGQRYVQENYLDGIEAFGLIEMFTNEFNEKIWRWIGIKALRNNGCE